MGEGDDENDDNGVMRLIVNIYEALFLSRACVMWETDK